MSQIRVELQLEDKSFVSGVWRAGQSLKDFKAELARTVPHFAKMQAAGQANIISLQRQEEHTRSLGQRMRDLAIIAGGATVAFQSLTGAGNGVVGSIIRVNSEMEKLRYQLAGMSSAAEPMREATDQLAYLQKLATTTPFSARELSTAFVKLKAAGLDPMNGSLRALTDGLAAFGGSDEQLHRVTIALTQMQGKGVLSMEELRQQLGESMPNAMQIFARSMGVTVGELSRLVSTGMVESSSAIEKFMGELDRSYAGTGQFMMQTFSGLMSRINTEFTNLVTGGPQRTGEMAKAFDMLKEKMGELADFLASQDAKNFFDSLGRGLQSLMRIMEALMPAFRNIRDFLVEWGSTIALVFGGALVMKAIGAFVSRLLAVKVAYEAMAVASRKARADMALTTSTMAVSNSAQLASLNTQMAAALAARQAVSGAALSSKLAGGGAFVANAGAMAAVAGSLGKALSLGVRFLGVLGPIGLGISILGPIAWEVGKGIYSWATGAKETNEALKETVAGQVDMIRLQRQAERERLVALREEANALQVESVDRFGVDNAGALIQIGALQKQIDAFDAETKRILADFLVSSVDIQVGEAKKRIDEATREISREYYQSMVDMDSEFKDAIETAEQRGVAARDVQEEFRNRRNDRRISRQRALIEAYDAEIEKLKEISDLDQVSPEAISALIDERERLQQEMEGWSADDFKVELVSGVESDEKKIERLTRGVESARERFKELQAEIGGASGEVAKLIYRIQRGDFGNFETGTEEMIRMRDILLETTIAVEALDEVMKGLNETNSEIARINENQEAEILRLQATIDGVDPSNEFDFYKWKRENGMLEGLGDPQMVVQEAIAAVTRGVDLSNTMFSAMGDTLKQQAFGEESIMRIDAVAAALGRVQGITSSINDTLSGINFGNMSIPLGSGSPLIRTNVDGGLLDLIADRESNGDYNATLDNGRWTNGPQNLVGMTLNEIRALQRSMLTEENQRVHGDGGSSALGRYQIVGRTLQRLMDDLGLDGNALFDEKMQDYLAAQLIKGRGRSAEGLRKEWEGLIGVSDADILSAYDRSTTGPTRTNAMLTGNGGATPVVRLTPETEDTLAAAVSEGQRREADGLASAEQNNAEIERLAPLAAFAEMMRELEAVRSAQTAGSGDERQGTNERRVREAIAGGRFAGLPTDELERMIALAIEADKHLADIQQRSRDQSRLDANSLKLEDERREIEQRRLDALSMAQDPNYKGQSSELAALIALEKEQLAIVEKLYGKDSDEYRAEASRLASQRSAIISAESAEAYASLVEAARESTTAAITDERQQRQMAFDQRVAELAALRDQAIADGALVAEANLAFERAVAAERAKLSQENRTQLQINAEQARDYAQNINNSVGELPQRLSEALSTGEGLKGFANSVREILTKNLYDAAAGYFLKPFEQFLAGDGTPGSGLGGLIERGISALTGGPGKLMNAMSGNAGLGGLIGMGGGKGAGAATGKGKSVPVGVKHTGGIVGRSGGWSGTSALSNFIGAPKFHTGGIVGQSKFRTGLSPSEVPIIAQRGEGVFTSEQMKHLGGTVNNRQFSINAPITVNASGGTPEQNADLAARMAEQTDRMFRSIVHDEMLRQMRPGGMLK